MSRHLLRAVICRVVHHWRHIHVCAHVAFLLAQGIKNHTQSSSLNHHYARRIAILCIGCHSWALPYACGTKEGRLSRKGCYATYYNRRLALVNTITPYEESLLQVADDYVASLLECISIDYDDHDMNDHNI